MNPKVSLAVSAAILLAGTVGASAQYASSYSSRYHWPVSPGYQSYAFDRGSHAYAYDPGYQGVSRRCLSAWQRYNTSPPGGVIQDRGYQQNVLGVQWC